MADRVFMMLEALEDHLDHMKEDERKLVMDLGVQYLEDHKALSEEQCVALEKLYGSCMGTEWAIRRMI